MEKFIIAFCIMSLIAVPLYLYLKHRETKHVVITTVAKGACIAVPLVLTAMQVGNGVFSLLVFLGMAAGAVGDVTLGLKFNVGMSFFFVGHILYTAAFLTIAPYSWYSLIVLILLGVAVSPLMRKHFPLCKENTPYYLYAAMIANMVSVALLLPLTVGGTGSYIIAAGSLLFAVSDCFVALSLKVKLTKFQDCFSLYIYFIGQFLIAFGASLLVSG